VNLTASELRRTSRHAIEFRRLVPGPCCNRESTTTNHGCIYPLSNEGADFLQKLLVSERADFLQKLLVSEPTFIP
jgi:hypothetical protein